MATPVFTQTFEFKVGPVTWHYAVDDAGIRADGPLGKHVAIPWDRVRGAAMGHQPEAGYLGSQLLLSVQEPGKPKPKLQRFPVHAGDPQAPRLAEAVASRLGPRWIGLGELNPMAAALGHSQAWAMWVAIGITLVVTGIVLVFVLS